MRLLLITTALTVAGFSAAALAQAPKPAARPPQASPNTVVATVNGEPIRMSDVAAAAQQLPPQVAQQVPPQQLFPKLIDNLISRRALLVQAHKQGLDHDPAVQKQMQSAADEILESAALRRAVLAKVNNEDAIKAQYDKQYAGKPGEPEIHARHILVDSEAKAKDVVAQLEKGAKFEELAKKYGDPKDAATQNGGDLGFFKKGDMLPEFSEAAFKLKVNEYTHTPVHTRYGWHVIQVLETRTSQPPTYDQVHDQIKQEVQQAQVQAVIAQARAGVKIQQFNGDGSPLAPGGTPSMPRPAAPRAAPVAAPAGK